MTGPRLSVGAFGCIRLIRYSPSGSSMRYAQSFESLIWMVTTRSTLVVGGYVSILLTSPRIVVLRVLAVIVSPMLRSGTFGMLGGVVLIDIQVSLSSALSSAESIYT